MKGVMFTVSTFLLLNTVLFFSMFYFSVSQERGGLSFTMFGDRHRFLESDIAESYLDLIDVGINHINRSGNQVVFNFSSLYEVSPSADYQSKITEYENFLEGLFERKTNLEIDASLVPDFTISPYNISFDTEGSVFYIYTDSTDMVNTYSITVQTNKLKNESSGSGKPGHSGPGYQYINVTILASDGQMIVSDERRLDPAQINDPFYSDFDDGSSINVTFGQINGLDGGLMVRVSGLTATINETVLIYNAAGNVFLEAGDEYSIKIGGISHDKLVLGFE